MDISISNSLYGYLETLYQVNQNLIRLCGYEAKGYFNQDTLMVDMLQKIPRILPISYNKKKGILLKKMMVLWI